MHAQHAFSNSIDSSSSSSRNVKRVCLTMDYYLDENAIILLRGKYLWYFSAILLPSLFKLNLWNYRGKMWHESHGTRCDWPSEYQIIIKQVRLRERWIISFLTLICFFWFTWFYVVKDSSEYDMYIDPNFGPPHVWSCVIKGEERICVGKLFKGEARF